MTVYHFARVQGTNYEVQKETNRPIVSSALAKQCGCLSILLAVVAIVLGTQAFDEKFCLEKWFIDQDVVCIDCSVIFGEECLGCTNSTMCSNCTVGFFWASNNDTTFGIVAETEIRCRTCAAHFGEECTACNQTQCTNSTGGYIDGDGQVVECTLVDNCADEECSLDGCSACAEGYYLDADGQCALCGDAISGCVSCSSETVCLACGIEGLTVSEDESACVCDKTDRPNAVFDAVAGTCSCAAGYHLHPTLGCSPCKYHVPGCFECAETEEDTGIPLDFYRMYGPDATATYLDCASCELAERFVSYPAGGQVKCESCQVAYEGCSSCGTTGDACTECLPTHILQQIQGSDDDASYDITVDGVTTTYSQEY